MKAPRLKTHHFHTKLPYQNLMLSQIKWWLQHGPITKNGVLPVATLFFWIFCFILRTSYNELICFTNNPNIHICTFCKRWSFIWWEYFFPVSILKWIQCFKIALSETQSKWDQQIFLLIFLLKLRLFFCFIFLLKILNQKATASKENIGFVVRVATILIFNKKSHNRPQWTL